MLIGSAAKAVRITADDLFAVSKAAPSVHSHLAVRDPSGSAPVDHRACPASTALLADLWGGHGSTLGEPLKSTAHLSTAAGGNILRYLQSV